MSCECTITEKTTSLPNRMISETLALHETRARCTLNLVASENLMSEEARAALRSDLTHRYCIPPEGQRPKEIWDYPNQRYTRRIERQTVEYAKQLYHGSYADVRPLSGNNVALIVLKSLVPRGGTVFSVPADCGGHFTTAVICKEEQLKHKYIPFRRKQGLVDLESLEHLAKATPPDLIFLDASMQLFPHPVREIRDIVGDGAIISFDASHTFGIIGGAEFQAPLLEGADLIHGSTHKSLFGPQKGMIVCRTNGWIAKKLYSSITPFYVSNLHCHHVAALGIALEELQTFGRLYARQVVSNARALARELHRRGVDVLFPERQFTNCHQVICRLGERADALRAFRKLQIAGIHVNAIAVPFCGGFGIRLGVSEMTRRGMKESESEAVAQFITDALVGDPRSVAKSVRKLCTDFSSIHYNFGCGSKTVCQGGPCSEFGTRRKYF